MRNLRRCLKSTIEILRLFIEIDIFGFGKHFREFLDISHKLMKLVFLLNFFFLKILIIRMFVLFVLVLVFALIMIVLNLLADDWHWLAPLLFDRPYWDGWRLFLVWFFGHEYFDFEILTGLFFFWLFWFLLRYIHLNGEIFFLSWFLVLPRLDWFLFFNFFYRFWLKDILNFLMWTFLQFMGNFRRYYLCWIGTFCTFVLFLFTGSLNNRFATFFLRSSLICFRISYLLSYFYFLAFSFISFSPFSAFYTFSIFSSFFSFYLSLRSCYFCYCLDVNFSCSSFERSLNMNGFIKIASIEGLFFWSTWSICKTSDFISLE